LVAEAAGGCLVEPHADHGRSVACDRVGVKHYRPPSGVIWCSRLSYRRNEPGRPGPIHPSRWQWASSTDVGACCRRRLKTDPVAAGENGPTS
jgi:hypothetical protein